MSYESFPTSKISSRASLVVVSGKLRGRSARRFGDHLLDLADQGIARVVVDMTQLSSTAVDSLGTLALEEALNRGLRLHLVVAPAFEFDYYFVSRALDSRGLEVHRTLDDALVCVREIVGSGMMPALV
jgi:STAS domain